MEASTTRALCSDGIRAKPPKISSTISAATAIARSMTTRLLRAREQSRSNAGDHPAEAVSSAEDLPSHGQRHFQCVYDCIDHPPLPWFDRYIQVLRLSDRAAIPPHAPRTTP